MPRRVKKRKEKIKVAFAGEIGAYSEEAAFKFFGGNIQTIPCQNFSEVFKKVEKGKVDFGIIPIENSLEGSVGQNYDLLYRSSLKVFGEVVLPIKHCLLVEKGVRLNSIKKVYSHPQALGQCRQFLESLKCEIIPWSDTAGSAKMIKEKKLKDAAAIASERAAFVYGLKILKRNIEDNKHNFTRFFIISKKSQKRTGKDKTSVAFSTKHTPGSLWQALAGFAQRKINLTKIESRPIPGKPWEYIFYLDFEGHLKEKEVQEALKDLKKNSISLKIFGSYPKNDNYLSN